MIEDLDTPVTATVITFPTAHHAFKAEQICQQAKIPVLLIPLPREIGNDCGTALAFVPKHQKKVADLLGASGVMITSTYQITRERKQARLWLKMLDFNGD